MGLGQQTEMDFNTPPRPSFEDERRNVGVRHKITVDRYDRLYKKGNDWFYASSPDGKPSDTDEDIKTYAEGMARLFDDSKEWYH